MRDQPTDTRTRLMDAAEARILDHGFAGTSIDAIIADVGVTKGAFFHHFPSKATLARALLDRYAKQDAEHLATFMERAERMSRDPLQQMLIFVGLFEEAMAERTDPFPGCLFASYCYEAQLFDEETHEVIRRAILLWRDRLGDKLREVAARHPPRVEVDLDDVADHMWVVFEGAFILSREMDQAGAVASQLRSYRTYLELLFGAPGVPLSDAPEEPAAERTRG